MGFCEDDRIRAKNRLFREKKVKVDERRFKLELHNELDISRVVEALAEAGLAVQLEVNNKIIVKK